jgi:hypothetical protein
MHMKPTFLEKLSPESQVRRAELAEALTEAGYPTSPGTLANLAVRGSGPPYSRWGKFPIYVWGDALAWAGRRRTPVSARAMDHKAAKRRAEIERPKTVLAAAGLTGGT